MSRCSLRRVSDSIGAQPVFEMGKQSEAVEGCAEGNNARSAFPTLLNAPLLFMACLPGIKHLISTQRQDRLIEDECVEYSFVLNEYL
jgi:hypothetical protein